MTITFETVDIPVTTYTVNPYIEAIKTQANGAILKGEKALTFYWDVTKEGVRHNYDKIKRELQAAGDPLNVTVRSHIYDADTGLKFKLPAEKGSKLVLVGSKDDPHKTVKRFNVVAWTTERIVRGSAEEDTEDDE